VNVTAHKQLAQQIQRALKADLRKDGARGRAMTENLGPLLKGDRLDAVSIGGQFLDSGVALGTLESYPVVCHFWRKSSASFLNHRCPLFEELFDVYMCGSQQSRAPGRHRVRFSSSCTAQAGPPIEHFHFCCGLHMQSKQEPNNCMLHQNVVGGFLHTFDEGVAQYAAGAGLAILLGS
jgi:hypothetical protein